MKKKLTQIARVAYLNSLLDLKKIPRRVSYTVGMPLVITILGLQALTLTDYQSLFDQKIFHPIIFSIRELIRPQALDPRIKIFAFDDSTAAALQKMDISLPEWSVLFRGLSNKADVRIVVDKLFDSPYSSDDVRVFSKTMDAVKAKISLISYTYPKRINYRNEIDPDLVKTNQLKIIGDKPDVDYLSALNKPRIPYGAKNEVLSKFAVFGHNEYAGDNRMHAILATTNSSFVPNTALTIADTVQVSDGRILINGSDIHADKKSGFLINFAPKSLYLKRTYGFYAAIHHAKKNKDISVVNPGDYVIILPAMYTGNTDWRQTPFGIMAGGYTLVAIVQSVLSGQWLREIHDPGFVVIIFGLIGFLSAYRLRPPHAVLFLVSSALLCVLTSLTLFIFIGTVYSFIFPIAALSVSCLAGIIVHSNVASIEDARIARDLEVANLVHQSFFSKNKLEEDSAISVQGGFAPATECGGDWWGKFQKKGFSYVMIGDAVGHGIPAALVTAVAFSVTRTIELELDKSGENGLGPANILKIINKIMCSIGTNQACMTFQVFRFNDKTGECLFANAGNPQPILIPSDPADSRLGKGQRLKTLLARGDTLGIEHDTDFTEHTITLNKGDRIVLYTDGLIENTSQKSGEPIGKTWLKNELEQQALAASNNIFENLWNSYRQTLGFNPPDDDVTIVVITAV